MKYYIGEIDSFIGESEITTTIKFKTDEAPDNYLDNVASSFWGECYNLDEDDSGMYDFGDRSAAGGRWHEITAAAYEQLKIITEL